jgi:cytochrome c2
MLLTAFSAGALGAEKGDPVAGEKAYKLRCVSCHSMEPGKNGAGPSMAGIVGKKAGSVTGFAYSGALKNSSLVLDEAGLDQFLADPRGTVPGSRMFVKVADVRARADIVAYLAAH